MFFFIKIIFSHTDKIIPINIIKPVVESLTNAEAFEEAYLGIFAYDFYNRKLDVIKVTLYIVTFLTSISWIVLAKSHSYVHTFLNFVVWYFGFIQVCLYVLINQLINLKLKRNEEEHL